MRLRTALAFVVLSLGASVGIQAADRATKVRKDLEDVLAGGKWIYNDLPRGLEEAQKTGKPLLVVIRCIPCDACAGFDEQVASLDSRVKNLLESFVRVRIPQGNSLDLSLFQFDYDLSFCAFFLNADRTIYGRFGSRSTQEDKTGDVSLTAFRDAMESVLKLHGDYAKVRDSLKAKTGGAPQFKIPEEYPALKGKYQSKIDYQGKVVESCIHCHQVRDAERKLYRSAGKPIPDPVLYPWPLPDVFGLSLDPRKRATVARVEKGSTAERSGFQVGDELVSLEGQPLISVADVQWVLHGAGEEGSLSARVRRGEKEEGLTIPLERGWRKRTEIGWRVSTWELRRMSLGGLVLEELPAAERAEAGLAGNALALRVKHVGEYGSHAVAKKAGVKKGDVIVAVDGKSDRLSESDLIAYGVQTRKPGDSVALTVLRGGERKEISFTLQ